MADIPDYSQLSGLTLCMLGCGNLGSAILQNLVEPPSEDAGKLPLKRIRICVRSEESQKRLSDKYRSERRFDEHRSKTDFITISRGQNALEVERSDIIILAVDPSDVESTLREDEMRQALTRSPVAGRARILISVVAGWSREKLQEQAFTERLHDSSRSPALVIRTLPNVGASVAQALTAIEISEPAPPKWALDRVDAIFKQIGTTVHIPPTLMDATTAVGGSTPAFWAVICDAFIDASVAVGVPRPLAQQMIFQSMLGTATMMQNGLHPALLRDQGTSPEGCTIGGLMVMEEGAVRGVLGKALREAVTIARQMGKVPHPNDTRQG